MKNQKSPPRKLDWKNSGPEMPAVVQGVIERWEQHLGRPLSHLRQFSAQVINEQKKKVLVLKLRQHYQR